MSNGIGWCGLGIGRIKTDIPMRPIRVELSILLPLFSYYFIFLRHLYYAYHRYVLVTCVLPPYQASSATRSYYRQMRYACPRLYRLTLMTCYILCSISNIPPGTDTSFFVGIKGVRFHVLFYIDSVGFVLRAPSLYKYQRKCTCLHIYWLTFM